MREACNALALTLSTSAWLAIAVDANCFRKTFPAGPILPNTSKARGMNSCPKLELCSAYIALFLASACLDALPLVDAF